VLVNPNLKNQRNEAQILVKNAQTAVSIQLGESLSVQGAKDDNNRN